MRCISRTNTPGNSNTSRWCPAPESWSFFRPSANSARTSKLATPIFNSFARVVISTLDVGCFQDYRRVTQTLMRPWGRRAWPRVAAAGQPTGKLEFHFNSHLPFAARKDLQHLGKLGSCEIRALRRNSIHGRGISSVEQIKEFQIHVQPGSFPKIKPFSESHIHIHEPRRHKVIASLCKIHAIEVVVAVNVWSRVRKRGAIVKPALRTKNTAE